MVFTYANTTSDSALTKAIASSKVKADFSSATKVFALSKVIAYLLALYLSDLPIETKSRPNFQRT